MDDDRKLLRRIAEGEAGALEELMSGYEDRLKGFLRIYLANPADREEVLSEVMTVIWTSAKRYRGDADPRYWIFGIARNLALRQVRRYRNSGGQPLDPNWPDQRADPIELARKSEAFQAVRSLPRKQREVVILSYLGYTSQEIAKILGIPAATVRSRLHYARKKLRKILGMEADEAEDDENDEDVGSDKDDDHES